MPKKEPQIYNLPKKDPKLAPSKAAKKIMHNLASMIKSPLSVLDTLGSTASSKQKKKKPRG